MKSLLGGLLVAALIAAAAALILDTGVQRTADVRFQTEGVRL